MDDVKISTAEMIGYLRRFGKKGSNNLSVLGRIGRFMEAIETPVGKELLSELAIDHERLLNKLASFEASDEDKAMYRAVRALLDRWSKRVMWYYEEIGKIKESASPK